MSKKKKWIIGVVIVLIFFTILGTVNDDSSSTSKAAKLEDVVDTEVETSEVSEETEVASEEESETEEVATASEPESETTTAKTGDYYVVGDSLDLVYTDTNGTKTDCEVTVTGWEPAWDDDSWSNVTLVFYTVKNIDDKDSIFWANASMQVYANDQYVEPTYWGEYGWGNAATLQPGTYYEGVYVADIDGNKVDTLSIYLGSFKWLLKGEGAKEVVAEDTTTTTTVEEEPYRITMDENAETANYAEYAFMNGVYGTYGDASDQYIINLFSAPEHDDVGNAIISYNSTSIMTELFYDNNGIVMLIGQSEDGYVVTITAYPEDPDTIMIEIMDEDYNILDDITTTRIPETNAG